MKKYLILIVILLVNCGISAKNKEDKVRAVGYPVFPKIINSNIPGAPILGQPLLITGLKADIRTEKHGLAYPAFYDWNKDGKTDLLLGEFATGKQGSNIKVFENKGTNKNPKFDGDYYYALDLKGDTITNYQWCCIGIHPRFIDLDNDCRTDILSGQYQPGAISWWRGTDIGFQPRVFVNQEMYIEEQSKLQIGLPQSNPLSFTYWTYTSANFADINNDGLFDLLVGGLGELRFAINEGTNENPKFGIRNNLLDIEGFPLKVFTPSNKASTTQRNNVSGTWKSFITPIDWDGDGVLDLLVTDVYTDNQQKDPIVFFRGVNTNKGLRFMKGIPLFSSDALSKTFPGCQPNICVCDYNSDGVNDIIIGISLPTVNGFIIDSLVSWSFINDLMIETPGKDIGELSYTKEGMDKLKARIKSDPSYRKLYLASDKLADDKYLTLRHRGFVYVMLGKKNPQKALLENEKQANEEKIKNSTQIAIDKSKDISSKPNFSRLITNGPVSIKIEAPRTINPNKEFEIGVTLNFEKGWHSYSDSKQNEALGMIPTRVEYNTPKELTQIDDPILPEPTILGGYEVFKGENVKFIQKFIMKEEHKLKNPIIEIIIHYQICNEFMCLPPVDEKIRIELSSV